VVADVTVEACYASLTASAQNITCSGVGLTNRWDCAARQIGGFERSGPCNPLGNNWQIIP
jgi:hypothetical protein